MVKYRIHGMKKDEVYDSFLTGYETTPLFDVSKGEAASMMGGLEITYKRKGGYTDVEYWGVGWASFSREDLVREEFQLTIESFEDMGYEVELIGGY